MKDIGQVIKKYRKHYSDLTQAQLGMAVFGLQVETAQAKMSKIESGKTSISVAELQKIEEALGLEIGTLDRELKEQIFKNRNSEDGLGPNAMLETRREILKQSIPYLDKEFPQLVDYLTTLCTAAKHKNRQLMSEILKGAVREIEGKDSTIDEQLS